MSVHLGIHTRMYGWLVLAALATSGSGLECYFCSEKQNPSCSDPFVVNETAVGCDRVRVVGLSAAALSHGLFSSQSPPFVALGPPPHVCYKAQVGGFVLRGCAHPDFCINTTVAGPCETCDEDRCNSASHLTLSFLTCILTLVHIFGTFI